VSQVEANTFDDPDPLNAADQFEMPIARRIAIARER